jgi:hypothetical protein
MTFTSSLPEAIFFFSNDFSMLHVQTRCGQQERCNSTVNWLCHAAGSLSIKEGTHARAHKESEYQFPCNHL